jgi:hypothetical protein
MRPEHAVSRCGVEWLADDVPSQPRQHCSQDRQVPRGLQEAREEKGLLKPETKAMQIVAWLKKDFGLGHGHAMAIYAVLKPLISPKAAKSV